MGRSRGYRGRYRRNNNDFGVGVIAMMFLLPLKLIGSCFYEDIVEDSYFKKN